MASVEQVLSSQFTFNHVLVWVCKNFNCGDTSMYQPGQACKGCGAKAGSLPEGFLGRWAILKREASKRAN